MVSQFLGKRGARFLRHQFAHQLDRRGSVVVRPALRCCGRLLKAVGGRGGPGPHSLPAIRTLAVKN